MQVYDDVDPFWAGKTLDAKAVLHHWKLSGGVEEWTSACGLKTRTPMYYGPWPTNTGDKCEQCETLLKQRR